MKKLALVALLVVACGTVNVVHAQTLALAFKAGDTYKYKFHSSTKQNITMGAMSMATNIDLSADESVTVKSVDSTGAADLTLTISNFAVKTVTGGITNTTTMTTIAPTDVKIGSDGHLITFDGDTVTSSNPFLAFTALGGGFFITAVLPDHSVKPGDTWSKTYDQTFPGDTGTGVHVTSNSKYLRDESVNGVKAAVVETKSTGTVDSSLKSTGFGLTINGTLTADVTTWIDPSGHRVIKTHSTSTDTGTLDFSSSSTSANQQIPGLSGPISDQGTATTDLTPA